MPSLNLRGKALTMCALLLLVGTTAAMDSVAYQLRFLGANTHLLEVQIQASDLKQPTVEFAMPAWCPGSYTINNYAALVQHFEAQDSAGHSLNWEKIDKQTWRIQLAGSNAVTVRYQVYANTMLPQWSQYDDRHAFISGPSVWMYMTDGKSKPIRLVVEAPEQWRIATAMRSSSPGVYEASDYDEFVDSTIEVSNFQEQDFIIAGTTYHVVVHDTLGQKDFAKFVSDLQKIVELEVKMFAPPGAVRPAPFDAYWFIYHISPKNTRALEHRNSTQIGFSSDWDDTQEQDWEGNAYQHKLTQSAHEFFHAWNGKRFRPKPLGPFDYSKEAITPSLWIVEGMTAYYEELMLLRAGLITPTDYLNSIAGLISDYESPWVRERSLEDTSRDAWFLSNDVNPVFAFVNGSEDSAWDTWMRQSSGGETNLSNTLGNYYDGGQLVGHLLDFAIRQSSGNKASLDDWMRMLYQHYAFPNPGYEPEDAIAELNHVSGANLSDFVRRYISGKEPFPYETYFGYAGITVEKKLDPNKAWMGVTRVRTPEGRAALISIVPGGPAERSGLEVGDVVISADQQNVDYDGFLQFVSGKKPGDFLKLTVMREGQLRNVTLIFGSSPFATYSLKQVEHPTALQHQIFASWTGAE